MAFRLRDGRRERERKRKPLDPIQCSAHFGRRGKNNLCGDKSNTRTVQTAGELWGQNHLYSSHYYCYYDSVITTSVAAFVCLVSRNTIERNLICTRQRELEEQKDMWASRTVRGEKENETTLAASHWVSHSSYCCPVCLVDDHNDCSEKCYQSN